MTDEEAIAALTEIRGVGEWTAHIFLIFGLARPDVFPRLDAALVAKMRRLYNLERTSSMDELIAIADNWRPYRSLAARYLWAHRESKPV